MSTSGTESKSFQHGPKKLSVAMASYLGQSPKEGGSTWEIMQEFVYMLEDTSSTENVP